MQLEVKKIYFCSIMLLSLKPLLIPETSLTLHSVAGHEGEKREHSCYILVERIQLNGNLEEQMETILLRKELIVILNID